MNKLILMVGASGSGKSTLRKELIAKDPALQVHSWDELRQEFTADQGTAEEKAVYKSLDNETRASIAFVLTTSDDMNKAFIKFFQQRFHEQMKSGSVLVDNVNVSAKGRNFFITAARAKGFEVIAYLFPVSKAQLIERVNARTDHKIPIAHILQQYKAIQLPSVGEVDKVEFVFNG